MIEREVKGRRSEQDCQGTEAWWCRGFIVVYYSKARCRWDLTTE